MTVAERALQAFADKQKADDAARTNRIAAAREKRYAALVEALDRILFVEGAVKAGNYPVSWHTGRDEEGYCSIEIDGLHFTYDIDRGDNLLELCVPYGGGFKPIAFTGWDGLGYVLTQYPCAMTANREPLDISD